MRTAPTLATRCIRSSTASSPRTRALKIQQHLEACSPCFEAFDFEAELKMIIGKKCCEEVPAGLTEKILSALRDDGGTEVTF